jgi:hypothetical protein
MSDNTEEVTPVETTEVTAEETTTDVSAELEKWKALARKNEQRAKENANAAQRLSEIEEANKSEFEKLAERAAAAEARADQIELSAARNEIALQKGLTPSQAKRLVGTTREELAADADDLLADLKASAPSVAPSSDAQGKQGEPVGQAKQITSRADLEGMTPEEINAARREGRLKALLNY